MKKTFKGQTWLRRQLEEQTSRLNSIEEGLRRSRSAGPSTSTGLSRRQRWYCTFTISCILHSYHTLGIMH